MVASVNNASIRWHYSTTHGWPVSLLEKLDLADLQVHCRLVSHLAIVPKSKRKGDQSLYADELNGRGREEEDLKKEQTKIFVCVKNTLETLISGKTVVVGTTSTDRVQLQRRFSTRLPPPPPTEEANRTTPAGGSSSTWVFGSLPKAPRPTQTIGHTLDPFFCVGCGVGWVGGKVPQEPSSSGSLPFCP